MTSGFVISHVDLRLAGHQLRERISSERCRVCDAPTREQKPYCTQHVDQMPYAKKVLEGIENYDPADDFIGQVKLEPGQPMGIYGRRINLDFSSTKKLVAKLHKQQRLLAVQEGRVTKVFDV